MPVCTNRRSTVSCKRCESTPIASRQLAAKLPLRQQVAIPIAFRHRGCPASGGRINPHPPLRFCGDSAHQKSSNGGTAVFVIFAGDRHTSHHYIEWIQGAAIHKQIAYFFKPKGVRRCRTSTTPRPSLPVATYCVIASASPVLCLFAADQSVEVVADIAGATAGCAQTATRQRARLFGACTVTRLPARSTNANASIHHNVFRRLVATDGTPRFQT